MKAIRLIEAIADIEKWRIGKDQMVVLAPLNTLAKMLELYKEGSLGDIFYDRYRVPRFSGVLIVEDEQCTKVVVRSLISDHRIEVEELIVKELEEK